jgi:hypothetical protein
MGLASCRITRRLSRRAHGIMPGHDNVNFAYSFTDDPIKRLKRLGIAGPPRMALLAWQPGLYATVSFENGTPSRDVARFVDAILGILLACGEDYPIDTKIDRLHSGGDPGQLRDRADPPVKRGQAFHSVDVWSSGTSGVGRNRTKTVDYYVKGPIVGFLLDARLRRITAGWRRLDDVMRLA